MSRMKATESELAEAYQDGHLLGYWAELPWDFERAPARTYTTTGGAFSRGIYDGEKVRQQHRRRTREILAAPQRMVADNETLQMLNNELSLSASAPRPVVDTTRQAEEVLEILVKAGALTKEDVR